MERMTYVSALNVVLNGGEITAEVRERLEALKASVEKRNATKSDKPTKNQLANEVLKDRIVASMIADMSYTVSDMIEMFPCLIKNAETGEKWSTQKVSNLAHALVDDGRLNITEVKRKTYFSLKAEA